MVAELQNRLKRLAEEQSRVSAPAENKALRESEERFRLLAENSNDMISRHAPDGTYLYASPACRNILGLEPYEIIGRDAYEFILPEDRHIVRAAHNLQLDKAHANTTTYRLVHRDGRALWVESTTRCVMSDKGEILEIHSATRNINDRRLAQQALEESEELYRSLIECASDVIMRLDPDHRIIFINQAIDRDIRAKLRGQRFIDSIHPDYHPQTLAALSQVFEHQKATAAELLVTQVDGQLRWFSCRFAPILNQGQTVAATVLATDITQRKETENALLLVRSAIENVQDAVVITTSDLTPPGPQIVYVNKAFERMTGYSKDEILGQSPRILQGPRTDRNVLEKLKVHLSQNRVFHGETINYRKDGTEYYLEWDISPVLDENGQVINYVSVQRDLTELRRQEEIARHNQAELAHVGRLSAMGEMASGLAHELNQPLTAISNYTRGCLRRLQASPHPDPKIAEAIEAASMQADRAGQIIRRLRQFIRKRVPQHIPVALNDVVRDAMALMTGEIRQHQVNVNLKLTQDIPMVKADHIQVEQVVLNLLRNGIEAMSDLPHPQRRLSIFTVVDNHGVRLTVRDNGPGMDSVTQDRIFEPFFTTKTRGLGMGLPICQSIVESHGGRLWVEKNPQSLPPVYQSESGAVFHLWLPQISPEDLQVSREPADTGDYP